MSLVEAVRTLYLAARRLPMVRQNLIARDRARFFLNGSTWPRFFGVYPTRVGAIDDARAAAAAVGYDHAPVASVSVAEMSRTWTSDYPVLFWLDRLLRHHRSVFDLGGHIGTKYHAWARYLAPHTELTWVVCDVPSIVEEGRRHASANGALRFTTEPMELAGHGILLLSGCLQYADFDVAELLTPIAVRPPAILINKLPTHDSEDLFTLENLHHAVVPYRIFNETDFVSRMTRSGYQMKDRWEVPESCVRIPFHEHIQPVHRGYFFSTVGA